MFRRKHKENKKHSDAFLINSYTESGNMLFLAQLFERYTHLLFGLCMKYLKNEEDSKDAIMQVFERLAEDLKKYEIKNFKSWIYTYTKNHCLGILRKRKTENEKQIDFFHQNRRNSMENDSFLHPNNKKEEKLVAMEAAIQQLKPKQKRCLELFYFDEKSYIEIAEKTGFTLKTVKSHVQNGKRMLKKLSEKELHRKKDEK